MSALLERIRDKLNPILEINAAKEALREALDAQERVTKEIQRCKVGLALQEKLYAEAATRQAALVELHAGRAAGEAVTDKQIAEAEAALRNASTIAESAVHARQGSLTAIERLESKAAVFPIGIEALRVNLKEAQAAVLVEKENAAQRVYKAKVDAFVVNAYAEYMGTVKAVDEAAEQLGIMGDSGIPGVYRRRLPGLSVNYSTKIEVLGVPTERGNGIRYDSTVFDLTNEIEKAAAPIRKQLASLA